MGRSAVYLSGVGERERKGMGHKA